MIDQAMIESASKQIANKKKDIKYDTRDYVIDYMIKKLEQEEFYIPLSYQRNFIWNDRDKCFFIESVLMGLPIPFMFFADTNDGRVEIVDGAQRVQTLVQFAQNQLTLKGLDILSDSNGFCFKDLDKTIQRRFLNTSIRVVYLEEGTTESTRQEIFRRINTGGKPAKASEARRGSYEGKFKDFVEKCAKDDLFNKLAPRTSLTEKRYEGYELVTRFFAYRDNYNEDFKGYSGRVAMYVDKYVEKMNELFEQDPSLERKYLDRFRNMLGYCHKILGDRGFRKNSNSKSTPRARFEAISVGISLALEQDPKLPPKNVTSWIDEAEFSEVTKADAANNKKQLKKRIEFVKNKLLQGE
ncbi:MAG: DUF262 domain-containing protein [Lachnospiraceae bacterium]|jgi:hypothetical protein|nr:DUF262 domain-containing protein [Lachnospiraceae bacterium]